MTRSAQAWGEAAVLPPRGLFAEVTVESRHCDEHRQHESESWCWILSRCSQSFGLGSDGFRSIWLHPGGLECSLLDGRRAHELIKEDRWTTQQPSGHRDAQRYIQCLFGNTDGCRCHAFGSGLTSGWGLVSKPVCLSTTTWSYFYTTAIKTQHEQSEGF